MKHINQWFNQTKVKGLFLLPFYLFIFLPSFAQVGTWKHYLAYHEVQDIYAADNYLFVLASNGLYQYNLNDESITTYDRTNGLSDTHITHIGWSQQAKRLIAVYENSNIDLVDTKGNVTNISALYRQNSYRCPHRWHLCLAGHGLCHHQSQYAEGRDYRHLHP